MPPFFPAQVPPPDPNALPWTWVALVAVAAVGVLFWQVMGAKDAIIAACAAREAGKDATIEGLRAELREMGKEAFVASTRQLEAAQEQAKAHAKAVEAMTALLNAREAGR